MLPSHMQHPFVDRYRDSHNASPRSLTDEDTMNPPTSGKYLLNMYTVLMVNGQLVHPMEIFIAPYFVFLQLIFTFWEHDH